MEPENSYRTWTFNYGRPDPESQRNRPVRLRLPLILFLATIVSTVWAGSIQAGVNLFREPWLFYKGLPFAITLMLILGVHESGHFLMCKVHGIPSTVPYFIPMPNLLGTMGAFIRIKVP